MWIALLVKTVSSEGNKSIYKILLCIVMGLDIRPVLTSGSYHPELLLAG